CSCWTAGARSRWQSRTVARPTSASTASTIASRCRCWCRTRWSSGRFRRAVRANGEALMSRHHFSIRGAASYVLVAAVAMAIGALDADAYRRRAAAGPSRPLDPVTTHREWVHIKNDTDSIRDYVGYHERKNNAPT